MGRERGSARSDRPSCATTPKNLLSETNGVARRLLATALAESLLLAGRIEFFDLRKPDQADATFARALQAAGEADDSLLGAAILAHAAFIPGWAQRRPEAAERLRAARTYARRGSASADFLAWLDAVEAECETICGHPKEALRAIAHAEELLAASSDRHAPEWFTWFSPARLGAFKGNTQLKARRYAQARDTLTTALTGLLADEGNNARSFSLTWPQSRSPRTNPIPPARVSMRPSTNWPLLGMPPAWNASARCGTLCSPGRTLTSSERSTTGSTVGERPSALCSVKSGDSIGQFGQRVDPQGRQPLGIRVMLLDGRPRSSPDQRGLETCENCRPDVVVEPVADVQSLVRL